MSEPFIGEIKMFAGSFAPRSYAFCDGQLLSISQNDALFSLLGTIYGGDGRTTFGLPDLRSRIPIHHGTGPGLSARPIGSKSGTETVTLTAGNLPPHSHAMSATTNGADDLNPSNKVFAQAANDIYVQDAPDVKMAGDAVSSAGGSQSHENMAPFQAIHYIIALFGIYPSRS